MQYTRTELLYRNDTIAIEYSPIDDWLYVNWKGYHNYDTVVAGCEKVLQLMQEHACYKLLNNNTYVEGQWSSAAQWCVETWLPEACRVGLKWVAWVYSPSVFSRLSADKTMKIAKHPDFVQLFDDMDLAKDWLRSQI